MMDICIFFFFQAEDGIRDKLVTGVQTCALPISWRHLIKTRLLLFSIACQIDNHDPTSTPETKKLLCKCRRPTLQNTLESLLITALRPRCSSCCRYRCRRRCALPQPRFPVPTVSCWPPAPAR